MSVTVEKLRNKWKVRTSTGVARNFFNEKEAKDFADSFQPKKVTKTLEVVEDIANEEDTFLEQPMAARKRKAVKKKPVPTNKKLYSRVKAEAKRKFNVYPSAYANGWLVKTYKARGGRYRMGNS